MCLDIAQVGRLVAAAAQRRPDHLALPDEPRIDWAFIDADKQGYRTYWDEIVPRLSPGGLVLVDNVLWSGKVVEESVTDDDTVALRAFNDYVLTDDRMETVLLPLADGLTIARRR